MSWCISGECVRLCYYVCLYLSQPVFVFMLLAWIKNTAVMRLTHPNLQQKLRCLLLVGCHTSFQSNKRQSNDAASAALMIALALEWWQRRCVRAWTCKVALLDLGNTLIKWYTGMRVVSIKPPPVTQSNFVVKTEVSAYPGDVFFCSSLSTSFTLRIFFSLGLFNLTSNCVQALKKFQIAS